MIDKLRAALKFLNRSHLKTQQAGARSAAGNALNYASVKVLDPSVLARAFAAADQGEITEQAALFELIEEQDAHIFGELSKRRRAVTGLGWQLTPVDDANQSELDRTVELAEMIRGIPRIEDAQYDLTDAIGKGFCALELNWSPGDVWLPRPGAETAAIQWVPQRLFRVANYGERAGALQYLKDGVPEPLIPGRWIIHEHRAKSGYIESSALFRVLAWTYAYKAYDVRDMQRFLETYGLPLRLGKYPTAIGDKERDALLRAVRNIGHDGAGIVPSTMSIDFVQATKTGTVSDFLSAVTYWEHKQSIAILGGTLTSQADGKTSTNALGTIHDKVRREIMLHDVRQIEPTLTEQLVKPIALLNGIFPEDRIPKWAYQTEEAPDQEKIVKVLKEAVSIGMEIDLEWAHNAMQIPRAGEGVTMLKAARVPMNGNDEDNKENDEKDEDEDDEDEKDEKEKAELKRRAALRRDDENDPAALAATRLQADTADEMRRMLETIEAMLQSASSLEEFREMLLAAWPDLDTEKMVESMTRAFMALDLAGRAEVVDENDGR
jgi:phage gp29-like protein